MIERMLHLLEKYPLNGVSHLCSLLPILIGVYNYKHLSRGLRVLPVLFTFYFISDSYSLWLAIYKKSTFSVQNIQPLWELLLISILYLAYFRSPLLKRLLLYATVGSSVIIVITFRTDSISPVSSTLQKLVAAALALMYLNQILREARVKNIARYSLFWISAGFLIYSTGTFFFSLFSAYLYADATSNDVFDAFWNLGQTMYILYVLLVVTGLWFATTDETNLI